MKMVIRNAVLRCVTIIVVAAAAVGGARIAIAQTTFGGLTPGVSTKAQAEGALGKAVQQTSPGSADYAPQQGTGTISVQYRADGIVDRIVVSFVQPVVRAALIKQVVPGVQPVRGRQNSNGRMVEFFGAPAFITPEQYRGDILEGQVRESKSSGKLTGKSSLNFTFEQLHHANQLVPVRSSVKAVINSKGKQDVDEEGRVVRKQNNLPKAVSAPRRDWC